MSVKKTTNKSIFVSSTFCDMQAERDALRDFVIPRVNEFAAKYGRAVEIIDLRWGVDTGSVSEAEQNHKVLRTCLDEIERSKPFFLGLIGDRYGWTPPRHEMSAAVEAAQFSLEDLNMSVTALEIQYGVLRSDSPSVCLFYFRENPDYTAMPDELSRIYQDGKENLDKLKRLKDEIRSRFGSDIKNYTAEVHENGLAVSKDWADMVAADITEKLRLEWGEPSDIPMSWKEQEREIQDIFRESRTMNFAGRTAAIADMSAFCLSDETEPQFLMMQGEAGSGKSGLLCKVMDEIENKCLLLPFCCGISSRSSLAENILRYFISLLCEKLMIEDDSDSITKFQDLKDRFAELLFAACNKTRVVAVVDALDQLFGNDETRRLLWISGRLPANFRLLCSIIDGPETDAIKQLGGEVRPVPPIDPAGEEAIIHSIAARHHKQIGNTVVEHILKKQTPDGAYSAQNPLYLSLITQDLVMMDRYELDIVQKYMSGGMSQPAALAKFMQQRIDETPGNPEGAYLTILNRLEKLIGCDFVRSVCGMIAISRGGLRESDIEGACKEVGIVFNPADFSWLRQMMKGHFSQGDTQQWDFSHQSLRRALRKEEHEELKRLNDALVVHFCNIIEHDDFSAREIIHHLCAANRPDLAAEMMAAYYDEHENVLARGLADVYTEYENGTAFLLAVPTSAEKVAATERWHITEIFIDCLPFLPENTRQFRIDLMLAALFLLEGQEDTEIQRTIAAQVREALFKLGHDDTKTQRTIAYGEKTIADLYTEIGQTEKANEYYQKSMKALESIFRQTGTTAALIDASISYSNMGKHLTSLGRTEEAGEYFKKFLAVAESIYQQTGTIEALKGLSASYDRMGEHLTSLGRIKEAEEYYQKSLDARESIYRQTGETMELRDFLVSYGNMGEHLTSLGRTEEAGEYYEKALETAESIYQQTGTISALRDLSVSYTKMGDHLTSLGRTEKAGEYYQKSLDARELIYRQTGTISALRDLLVSYIKIGDHLTSLGQTEEAGNYYKKFMEAAESIYRQTGTISALSDLSVSYSKMGDHFTSLDRIEEAEEYYQKFMEAAESIYRQTGTISALSDLSGSYNRMGDHLTSIGRIEEAGEYYKKFMEAAESIYRQTDTIPALRGLSISYERMGDHFTSLGWTDEVEDYYKKSMDVRESIYQQTSEITVLWNLSVLYCKMGDHLTSLGKTEEASEYYQKFLEAAVPIYQQTGEASVLWNAITTYDKLGDNKYTLGLYDEAHSYRLKALELFEQYVKMDPDVQKYDSYFRDKVKQGETE